MEDSKTTESYLRYRVKKSKRVDYADTLEIILENDFKEEENFYYVNFEEVDRKVKKFHNNVWGLKATRLWINGNEVFIEEVRYGNVIETIFCPYKENCDGICKHDIGLMSHWSISTEDPFYYEKAAETRSLEGVLRWFKESSESTEPNYRDEYVLAEMNKLSILELEEDEKKFTIDKTIIEKYIQKKLGFELEYCPVISKQDTLSIIDEYPREISITNEMLKHFAGERLTSGSTISRIERIEDEEEMDEYVYEKEVTKIIGDELEERLRKVLSEFFEERK